MARRDAQPADLPGFSQKPVTRRTVIAGAGAAIAAVGGRGLFGPLGTAVAETIDKPWKHAMDPRGSDIALTAGKQTEARFGFMFKDPPSHGPPNELLQQLAAQMGEPAEASLENPDIFGLSKLTSPLDAGRISIRSSTRPTASTCASCAPPRVSKTCHAWMTALR